MISETDLIAASNGYIQISKNYQERWAKYLTEPCSPLDTPLLFAEIDYAHSRGLSISPKCERNHTMRCLTLLVGDSFEPLLQSIIVYQPDALLLLLSNYYDDRPDEPTELNATGKRRRIHIETLLNKLNDGLKKYKPIYTYCWDLTTCHLCYSHVEDNENAVFTTLQKEIPKLIQNTMNSNNEKGWEILVDITGGKKPMVAGAFMYAAYTDAQIRYVDFDKYDTDHHPYGYTCRFREVTNLYTKFHLNEWERTKGFYEAYDFHSALAALPPDPDPPEPGYAPLKSFLQMCSDWSNWLYPEAYASYQNLPDNVKDITPTVIRKLGELDPFRENDSTTFFSNPQAVAWYARDAFLYADRLIRLAGKKSDDNRARNNPALERRNAFTRAFSLHETLLKARIYLLWKNQSLVSKDKTVIDIYVVDKIFNFWGIDKKIDLLRGQTVENIYCQGELPLLQLSTQSERTDREITLNDLRIERNAIVHGARPVRLHREALILAKSNLINYLVDWSKLSHEELSEVKNDCNFECPSWKTLVDTCGLKFLSNL